jgi:hypothetical protein
MVLFYSKFALFVFKLFLGPVALDILSDGSAVVGTSENIVIAHNTATGAVLWRKEMLSFVSSLRIHRGVVVIPVDNNTTAVLDVTTGHQLHALPSAGQVVIAIRVFDGLTSGFICFIDFLTQSYMLSAPLTKIALRLDGTPDALRLGL